MVRAARELLLTALTAATVLLAIASWRAIAAGLSHAVGTVVLTGTVVAGIGAILRIAVPSSWPSLRVLTVLLQMAAAWSVVSVRIAGTPVPLPYVPRMRLEDAFVAAGDAILHGTPPVPVVDGVLPLVLCGAAVAFVLADLLARTVRLPAIAGLVLLAVVAVPISVMGSDPDVTGAERRGVAPVLFALVALGWLAQMVLAEDDRLSRWGRQIESPDGERSRAKAAGSPGHVRGWAVTASIGVLATLLALLVPLALPSTKTDFSGWGGGSGGGNGKVSVTNPMIDVRQNLVQGRDVPLVRVRTEDPDPTYLRIAVLTRFTSTQWTAGDRSIPEGQVADGPIPIAGLPSAERFAQTPYRISITDAFASRWLPTPAPINLIHADGDWRYDVSTDDFIAADKSLTTAGLTYTAARVRIDLTAAGLNAMSAGNGLVSALYTSVPADLPPIVGQLAREVTRGAATPLEKAVALQSWFRRDGGFEYSTNVTLGSGGADLATFLNPGGRAGYCQQFSAAMAAMARTLGIPSRVAVGFLNPDQQPDGSYVFSSHDMHAWPELYFAGAGWVRFEPTPAAAGTTVPSYAHDPGPTGGPSAGPSASASASASAKPSVTPSAAPKPGENRDATSTRTDHHLGRWLAGVLVGGLVAFAVALPGILRRRRRTLRLGIGADPISAEDGWAELRDTALDLGLPWLDGHSPRDTRPLVERYVVTDAGRLALDRLVDAVERERYASSSEPLDPQTVRAVIDALAQGDTPVSARRAAWWPRSVLGRRGAAIETSVDLDRVGG